MNSEIRSYKTYLHFRNSGVIILLLCARTMFKELLKLVVLAILTYIATADDDKPKVWSGNLQFSEEGFLKDDDVRRIQKEIQVISRYFQQMFNHIVISKYPYVHDQPYL